MIRGFLSGLTETGAPIGMILLIVASIIIFIKFRKYFKYILLIIIAIFFLTGSFKPLVNMISPLASAEESNINTEELADGINDFNIEDLDSTDISKYTIENADYAGGLNELIGTIKGILNNKENQEFALNTYNNVSKIFDFLPKEEVEEAINTGVSNMLNNQDENFYARNLHVKTE